MQCPRCGSTEIKKASAAYEQMSGSAHLSGLEISDGGIGTVSTSGTFSSRAADRLSPPSKPSNGCGCRSAIVFFLVWLVPSLAISVTGLPWPVILIAWVVMFFVACTVIAPGVKKAKDLAAKQHEKEQTAYDRLWYCLRCGELADVGSFRSEFQAARTPGRTVETGEDPDSAGWLKD